MAENSIQYGSLDSITTNCTFEVGIIREPSLNLDHGDIDYFEVLLPNVVSIEVRESIDMMFRTATVTLQARTSIRETMPFTGNEIISVSYKNQFHEGIANLKKKIIHFKIFDINEIENLSEQNSATGGTFINLYLVEWPIFDFLFDENYYKTFPITSKPEDGIIASTLIENIFKSVGGFENFYDISVESTPDDYKFNDMWIPRWTISKAIKYFSQFLINDNGDPYYYFGIRSSIDGAGNKPEAFFKSIYSMFESPHFRTYSTLKPDNFFKKRAPPKGSGKSETLIDIPKPENDKNYNPLDYIYSRSIEFGDSYKVFQKQLAGRTTISHDYMSGNKHNSITFESFMRNYKTLGQTLPYPDDKNFGNQWHLYETSPYNNGNMRDGYLKNKMVKGTFKQMFCKAQCLLNETRVIGEKVELYLPAPSPTRPMDYQMSGRWMTYSIVDIITANGRCFSEVTFARDSFWINEGQYLSKSLNMVEDDINRAGSV